MFVHVGIIHTSFRNLMSRFLNKTRRVCAETKTDVFQFFAIFKIFGMRFTNEQMKKYTDFSVKM